MGKIKNKNIPGSEFVLMLFLFCGLVVGAPPTWVKTGTVVSYDGVSATMAGEATVVPGTAVTVVMQYTVQSISGGNIIMQRTTTNVLTGQVYIQQLTNSYDAPLGDFWLDPAVAATIKKGSTVVHNGLPFTADRGAATINGKNYNDVIGLNYHQGANRYTYYIDASTCLLVAYTEIPNPQTTYLYYKSSNVDFSQYQATGSVGNTAGTSWAAASTATAGTTPEYLGYWENKQMNFELDLETGGHYLMQVGGKSVTGTYTVQGNKLYLTANGKTTTYTCQVSADRKTMYLTDPNGTTVVLTKKADVGGSITSTGTASSYTAKFIGIWGSSSGEEFVFKAGSTFSLTYQGQNIASGTYAATGTTLTLVLNGQSVSYPYYFEGNDKFHMMLKNGQTNTFVRKGQPITGGAQQPTPSTTPATGPSTPAVQNISSVWALPKNQSGVAPLQPLPQPPGCNAAIATVTAAIIGALFFSLYRKPACVQ